jgi:IS605 OrfB family transposase
VCLEYDKSRRQQCKPWLRWRSKRSLGWVPFNTGYVALRDGAFVFRGERYEVWLHRSLPEGKIGAGSFSQDARGRWYINCPVKVGETMLAEAPCVGVDLGLKDLATLSTGERIEAPNFYRKSELKLGKAQRARKSKRVRAIHAKVANRRREFLHQETNKILKKYGFIVVGDVSSTKLSRTRLAKSVLDAGWSTFKDMLSWKLRLRGGGMLLEVSEQYTSQVCSGCGSLPASRPRGIADLGMREWCCDDCGTVHDRDVNAARNILRAGLRTLVGGARV